MPNGTGLARLTVLASLVAATITVNTAPTQAFAPPVRGPAKSEVLDIVQLDGGGDRFYNFDFHIADDGSSTDSPDWPVNLVFVSKRPDLISKSIVQDAARDTFSHGGGFKEARFPLLSDAVPALSARDSDKGLKKHPGLKCNADSKNATGELTGVDEILRLGRYEPDFNYHYRLYGPGGEVLRSPRYGSFLVATSHIDYRENCGENSGAPLVDNDGRWGLAGFSGESEEAERYVARTFAMKGYLVEYDKINLRNPLPRERDEEVSDGLATVIHMDVITAPPDLLLPENKQVGLSENKQVGLSENKQVGLSENS